MPGSSPTVPSTFSSPTCGGSSRRPRRTACRIPSCSGGGKDEAGRFGVYAKGKKNPGAVFESREEAEEFLGQDGQMIDYMVAAVVKGAVNLGSVGDGFRYGPSRLHGVYQVQGLANALDQSAAALRARLHRPAVGVQGAAGDSAAWAL